MEQLNFRTSSGIKSIVGKDLITDKFVAIFELVKNGYDANASKIVVSFNNIDHINNQDASQSKQQNLTLEEEIKANTQEPHIVIADNGSGMNKDDLINKWLYLAYSNKQEGSKNEERVFVGSKGIGRFSCDTLGSLLNIRTKKADENIEHILVVDWTNFEQDLRKEFEKINVKYASRVMNNTDHYTILTIKSLRNNTWQTGAEQDKAKENLERLKNPFVEDEHFNIYLGRDLSLEHPNPQSKIYNNITEILKDRTTTIEAHIDKEIKIQLYDRGEIIYKASKPNTTLLNNTSIHILLNYLNTSAKNMFTRRMKMQPVHYGNIFIYKNNFRVMPYGDKDYDLFGLNIRKAQGYNRYLGPRELIGYISIQDKNHLFKETSSRNKGFIENAFFNTLKDIYLSDIHVVLERYIHLIKWGEDSETREEIFLDSSINSNEIDKFKKYITNKDFVFNYFKDNLSIDENTEKQLDKIIADTNDENTKKTIQKAKDKIFDLKEEGKKKEEALTSKEIEVEKLHKQNENLRKLREPSSYMEQISHHFKSMVDDLYYATEDLIKIVHKVDDKQLKRQALDQIANVRSTQKELGMFRDLLINTNLDMRSKQVINWYEQACFYVENKKKGLGINVTCNITNEDYILNWDKTCDVLQFQIALDNFYQNARENNGTSLDILFTENTISFSSDSNKIEAVDLANIFELGYSTKPNGTGIGLHQIQKFFNTNDYAISIEQADNIVCFTIKTRK